MRPKCYFDDNAPYVSDLTSFICNSGFGRYVSGNVTPQYPRVARFAQHLAIIALLFISPKP